MVGRALKPEGRVLFVDSLKIQDSTAMDHVLIDDSGTAERKLNNGRSFKIVKIFYDLIQLQQSLLDFGFSGIVRKTDEFFYYGCVTKCI